MSIDCAKQIAKQLMALNMNILCWNRAHIEKSFNINGKTKERALTIRQFHVLMFIKNANIHTLSEIAKWFSISKSSMSIMLSKLEKLGYLTRKQEADMDGRKVFFHLTTKGKRLWQRQKKWLWIPLLLVLANSMPRHKHVVWRI